MAASPDLLEHKRYFLPQTISYVCNTSSTEEPLLPRLSVKTVGHLQAKPQE